MYFKFIKRCRLLIDLSFITVIIILLVTYPDRQKVPNRQLIVRTNDVNFNTNTNTNTKKDIKLFCLIFTKTDRIYGDRTRNVNNTWAKQCDKYYFVTKKTNETYTDYKIFNEPFPLFQPRNLSNDSYYILTDRLYQTYIDIYKLYPDYDFYFKSDDDTYVFVDNLRDFLSKKNPRDPVTFGYDLKSLVDYGYPAGGSGFVLTHEAFKRISTKLDQDYKFCPNTGTDDVDVAKCLRLLHVYPSPTYDEIGRERFHPLDIYTFIKGEFPDWLPKNSANPVKWGIECCSNTTISFHYTTPEDTLTLFKMWNDGKARNLTNDENIQLILKHFTR